MRVLVASDTIGSLSSARAGAALGTGWPDQDVTVVSLGESRSGFAAAAADQLGVELETSVLGDLLVSTAAGAGTVLVAVESVHPHRGPSETEIPVHATSVGLGDAVSRALQDAGPALRTLVVDLGEPDVHDGGAGFLGALGAEADVELDAGVAGLGSLARISLDRARRRTAGVDLVGVVPFDQLDQRLLGLRGITSMRRGPETDPGSLLDTDAALSRFAQLVAPEQAERPGAGACGGLGFAILALGGRLTTGSRLALESGSARQALVSTDLVVTGCTVFDFARRGGGVVAEAARIATEQLCPCIAVAGEVLIGGRELRTMGIESAYAVRAPALTPTRGADVDETELIGTAARIGRSWRW